MTDKHQELNKIYERLADNLDIPITMSEKAIKSYEAVGKWLGECDPEYDIRIMPQGSFYLGTVVKPLSDKDKYDIDLVCLLKNGQTLSEYNIKNIVGNRLRENERYQKMMEKEGKRCWTLNYDEFHMDILPCVPNQKLFKEHFMTEIKLTHKKNPNHYISKYSNPYKYHSWFEDRIKTTLMELKKELSIREKVEIDEITTAKARTPLQKSIQILKRHRDIMFKGNEDNAPISIIITTLAAHAYDNENDIFSALENILNILENFIETRANNEYWISNPAMPLENFAEKWNEDSSKRDAFFAWVEEARKDIIKNPTNSIGLDSVIEKYKLSFGKQIVEKSMSDIAIETKNLRENNKLHIAGLTGGLTTVSSESVTRIKRHTFFGK